MQDSAPITGTVKRITLETDPNTGVTTIIVDVVSIDQVTQTVRVSQEIAIKLGIVALDGDGKPMINDLALGQPIEIDPATVIHAEEPRHPVGNALAAFFSEVPGLDYDTVMKAHDRGMGFGVIAQALWVTAKLEGNADVFRELLTAKETGDYTAFTLADGTIPKNWGQLQKAILDGKKISNLGAIMSDKDNHGNESIQDNNKDKNKDKNDNGSGNNKDKNKDKNDNGNGNGQDKDKDKNNNGNSNSEGENGNGNDKEKDK